MSYFIILWAGIAVGLFSILSFADVAYMIDGVIYWNSPTLFGYVWIIMTIIGVVVSYFLIQAPHLTITMVIS